MLVSSPWLVAFLVVIKASRRERKDVPAPDEGGAWKGDEKVVGTHQGEATEVERLEERPQSERKEEEARGSVSEEGAHVCKS